jgi:hypothetical protein
VLVRGAQMEESGGFLDMCRCLWGQPGVAATEGPPSEMVFGMLMDMAAVPGVQRAVASSGCLGAVVRALQGAPAAAGRLQAVLVLCRLTCHSSECQLASLKVSPAPQPRLPLAVCIASCAFSVRAVLCCEVLPALGCAARCASCVVGAVRAPRCGAPGNKGRCRSTLGTPALHPGPDHSSKHTTAACSNTVCSTTRLYRCSRRAQSAPHRPPALCCCAVVLTALLAVQAGCVPTVVAMMECGEPAEKVHAARLAAILAQHPAAHHTFRTQNVIVPLVSEREVEQRTCSRGCSCLLA